MYEDARRRLRLTNRTPVPGAGMPAGGRAGGVPLYLRALACCEYGHYCATSQ